MKTGSRRRANVKRGGSSRVPVKQEEEQPKLAERMKQRMSEFSGRISKLAASVGTRRETQTEAREPSPWRRRLLVGALELSVAGAVAWGLLVCGREVYEYATTSARFEVQHFIYEPSAHVDDDTLRELLSIEPGTNILACDLPALSERIAAHPWVARATITRNMPDTLEVVVVEHEAAAIVLSSSHFYLVNQAGLPFKEVAPGERGELPIVTGVERERLLAPIAQQQDEVATEGELVPLPELVEALALIDLYQGKERPQLGELNLGEDGSVTLYTASAGTALRLGREDYDQRLERWDALRVALGDRAERLAVVHLDHQSRPDRRDRVVARFASEQDEVVLLAAAASERAQGETKPKPRAEQARASKPKPLPARAAGRRNRIPSYE